MSKAIYCSKEFLRALGETYGSGWLITCLLAFPEETIAIFRIQWDQERISNQQKIDNWLMELAKLDVDQFLKSQRL